MLSAVGKIQPISPFNYVRVALESTEKLQLIFDQATTNYRERLLINRHNNLLALTLISSTVAVITSAVIFYENFINGERNINKAATSVLMLACICGFIFLKIRESLLCMEMDKFSKDEKKFNENELNLLNRFEVQLNVLQIVQKKIHLNKRPKTELKVIQQAMVKLENCYITYEEAKSSFEIQNKPNIEF